ncbi:MAG: MATE family efflux transporter [Victivallales bacterium]|nr:MATE family efflux transporter [Victivallales bacterium]
MSSKHAKYTRGSIGGTMIKTALSMIPATLALSGYNIADTYFVSKLGTNPLAAMGFTFPLVMLAGCIFRGMAVGAATPLAHALGGSKHSKAAKMASSGLLLIALCSVVICVTGLLSLDWMLRQFGAGREPEVLSMASGYMQIWFLGCITAAFPMTCNDFLIASGASRSASGMMVAGMLLNVVLDPIFIFGLGPVPAMGIKGAALATVMTQMITGITLLMILKFRYGLLTFKVLQWRLLRISWRVIIRMAVPSIIAMLMMPAGNMIMTRIIAEFGVAAVAACAAAGRLEMVAFVVPMSLGMSLMPMIAQNYGAKHYERINQCRRFAMRFAGIFELLMAGVYFISAPWLAAVFSDDAEVIRLMTVYLRIIPFGFGMMEIHRYCGFVYTGCNRPVATAWLNALRLIGLLIPLSLMALWLDSLYGLFVARLAADLLSGAAGLWLVRGMTLKLLHGGGDKKTQSPLEVLPLPESMGDMG